MRLSTGPIFGSGLALALVAAGATGCADNESSLFVRQVQAMQPPQCTVTADPSASFMPYGSLDLIIGGDNGYQAALLVGNQLAQRGSTTQIRTETARVSLRGAIVRVLDDTGAEITSFTVDGSGFVDPGSGESPGFGLLGTTLIPPQFASYGYLGWVTVWVKVFGRTLGGKDIESNELTYPIDVCNGCLVSFPSKAVELDTGNCTHAGATEYTVPCIPGQDAPVPCTFCMDNPATRSVCLHP
jgi:hypothetical protein